MGLFDLFKSQTKKKWPGVNPQVLADFQVAQNFLRIRKDLIDKNEHQDWKNFRKEGEMIWIDNMHPNFFLYLGGGKSIDNSQGRYKLKENGKLDMKDVLSKIIQSDNIIDYKDDINYLINYFDILIGDNS